MAKKKKHDVLTQGPIPAPIWVKIPGMEPYKTYTITSTHEHLGNLLYEGKINEEEYVPNLVESHRNELLRHKTEANIARSELAALKGHTKHWLFKVIVWLEVVGSYFTRKK